MSLYLKYRPRDFETLVGQKFIKQTLKNALEHDKLVGAYLFTGPRGTGKTSTARILALGMNCLGTTTKPCYQCSICKSFSENQLLDIIEIDAASNTGVDNIREIIERAQFSPNQTRFKVYIIDEVHMLSKGAFNALLKILEEPPSHVKFILATTEIHKVPETILSRCQRYDFKSIHDENVKERLKFIGNEENIIVEEKALNYIVKNAKGGLRNAINLFEQLVIGGKIGYEYIIENLGITEDETLENIYQKLYKNDITVISSYQELIDSGKNIRLFFKDLFYISKDKIVMGLTAGKNIEREREILEILDETFTKSKHSFDEQITFLTGILKIVQHQSTQKNISSISNTASLEKEKISTVSPKEIIKTEEIPSKTTLVSEGDIHDIFGKTSENTNPGIGEMKQEIGTSGAGFDKNAYIQLLKESGMRGGIIVSLKGAIFNKVSEGYEVKLASSIALKSLELEKNTGLYNDTLQLLTGENTKIVFRT